jgi:hypothetical protein
VPVSVPCRLGPCLFISETPLQVVFHSRFLLVWVFCFLTLEIYTIVLRIVLEYIMITRKIHGKLCDKQKSVMSFYKSFASRLACATCARRWARSEFCAPCAPFFVPCVFWIGGATPVCESAIGVTSDEKPGMRMLWLRSVSICVS